MNEVQWDETVDVVVLGSGAAGMSAALTCHFEGLRALLLEKTDRIGGSTAVSGGAVWIPLNPGAAGAGHGDDTFEQVWEYLRRTVGDASSPDMLRAYLDNGPAMVEYLQARGALALAARQYSPDYYPDRPGASLGGRAMDPLPFDGRRLGAHFKELRDPLKEFVVLGGMMVNVTDVYHPAGRLALAQVVLAWRQTGAGLLAGPPARPSSRHASAAGQRPGRVAVSRRPAGTDPLSPEYAGPAAVPRRARPRRGCRGRAGRHRAAHPGAAGRRRRHRRFPLGCRTAGRLLSAAHRALVHGARGQPGRRHRPGARGRRGHGHGPCVAGVLGAGVPVAQGGWHGGPLPAPGLGPRQAGA